MYHCSYNRILLIILVVAMVSCSNKDLNFVAQKSEHNLLNSSLTDNSNASNVAIAKDLKDLFSVSLTYNAKQKSNKLKLHSKMDEADRILALSLMQQSLETAVDAIAIKWNNPDNNHSGTLKILSTQGIVDSNQVCRGFVHIISINQQTEEIHGTACRQMWDPESQWKLIS